MVASDPDEPHHDGEDCEMCPTCEFRERLNALICRASDGSEKVWNACQGDLADQMFDAVYALHRSRRERFTDRHDEIANAWEAATRLVELYEGLRRLRRRVMADDSLLNEDATEDW